MKGSANNVAVPEPIPYRLTTLAIGHDISQRINHVDVSSRGPELTVGNPAFFRELVIGFISHTERHQ